MNLPLALVATIFAAAAAKENHSVTLSDASHLVKTNLRVRTHPVYPTKLRNVASLHPELEKLRYLKEDKQSKQDRQAEKDDEMVVEKQAKQKQEKQDKQEKVEKAEQKAQKENKDVKDQEKEVAAKNKNHSRNLGLGLGITFSLAAILMGSWYLVSTGKVKLEPIKEYFQKIPDRFSEWKKQKLGSRQKVQPDQASKTSNGVSGNVHSVVNV
jgi:Fe2+ transport system protein B